MKVDSYCLIAAQLEQQGFPKDDLFIRIIPTQSEDWLFDNQEAQLLQS